MSLPVIPVGNKLLVEPLPKKEEKINNIVIAESVNANLLEGKVAAVSKQIKDLYKVGDVVLYVEGKGVGQPIAGKYYVWLDADVNKEEIYGIVTEK